MTWRIVYIEESEYLSLYLDSIKVKRVNDEIKIPLSDINTILINNYKTTISVQLINKCMDYNINIITCGINQLPKSIIIPQSGHFKTAYIQRAQLEWDSDLKQTIWKEIIKKKILNQLACLKMNDKDENVINKMNQYIDEVQKGDKTNREGLAAKIYFRELYGKNFKRFSDDVINAALNYGYSILRSQISRTIVAKGLNSHFGFFHKGPQNKFNLSDDLIEVFRPIIDNFVYKNFINEEIFKKEHRMQLIRLTTTKVLYNGKKQTLLNIMNLNIDGILNFIETGDFSKLVFPVLIDYEL